MPSPFHGINMASNALRMFQRALDTTGHNISNVNTAGYSRQTVDFSQLEPTLFYSQNRLQALGNGVTIASVNRIRDVFLEARRQGVSSEQGRLGTLSTALGKVEQLFQEPGGTGINDALNKFFNAWSSLASNPNEAGNRIQVQLAGQTLSDRVRNAFNDLRALQAQQNQAVTDTISQVQVLTNRIADLNTQIKAKTAMGAQPNDLLDLRDQTLQQLSTLVNITPYQQGDGAISVVMGNLPLVDTQGAYQFPTTFDAATMSMTGPGGPYRVSSGQLAGLFQSLNDIQGYMGQLDNLANTLRTQINSAHMTGTNPLGNTNVPFFNDVVPPATQTGAIDFDLSAAIKTDPQAIASSVTGLAGDGSLALSLSRLRDTGIPGFGGRTFSRFFGDLVGEIGRDSVAAQTSLETQNAVALQVDQQIQAVSGVSLDDEMANMLRFQRSYQAAAKVLSVFDQVTQDIINLIR